MPRIVASSLLLFLLVAPGCVISTQEGERTHVNAADPDEITFHFDTAFNKAMLFGRSAALGSLALWVFPWRRSGGGHGVQIGLAVLALVASGWLLAADWSRVFDYRIEVLRGELHLQIPQQPEARIPWSRIDSIEAEGKALDVRLGGGMQWASEWEDLTITLADEREHFVDLRPLSVEQRGTLWRAIARMAELETRTWVEPRPG